MIVDFSGLAQAIWTAFVTGVTAIIGPMPDEFEQWLLQQLQALLSQTEGVNLLTQIPLDWTTRDADVAGMFRGAWPAQLVIAVLAMTIQSFLVMSGRLDVYEAVGRTVFFTLLGEGTLIIDDPIFRMVNAASVWALGEPVNMVNATNASGLEIGAALIVALVFAVFAWLKGAVGIVFLKVLLVSAPYLITLSSVPFLSSLGTWWAEEFSIWTLRPFMVALVLRLGLGLMARNSGLLGVLFAIVSFWLAYTMDTRIRRLSMGTWGSIGQLGVFARGARLVAGAVSGGAAGATAGAGAAATPAAVGAAAAVP